MTARQNSDQPYLGFFLLSLKHVLAAYFPQHDECGLDQITYEPLYVTADLSPFLPLRSFDLDEPRLCTVGKAPSNFRLAVV